MHNYPDPSATLRNKIRFNLQQLRKIGSTWSTSTIVIRSPLVRVTTFIPILGYVVLYNDRIPEWMAGEVLFISPYERVRLLYFGGLSVLISLIVYLIRCPSICKRNPSRYHAADEFNRIGTPRDVELSLARVIIEPIPKTLKFMKLSTHVALLKNLTENDAELSDDLKSNRLKQLQDAKKYLSENFYDEDEVPNLSRTIITPAEATELRHKFGMMRMKYYFWPMENKYFRQPAYFSHAQDLYTERFAIENAGRSLSSRIVMFSSVLGIIMLGIPSFEVLLRVLWDMIK